MLVLLLVSVCGGEVLQVDQPECPTWFIPQEINGTVECECGSSADTQVRCDQASNSTQLRTCMTYDESSDSTVVGDCPYRYYVYEETHTHQWMNPPQNVLDLNDFMCGGLNRTGLLCGKCQSGLGPVVMTNTLKCMKCLDNGLGWLLYIFLATFPSTIFFLVILFCKIRITSGPLNCLILVCQALSAGLSVTPTSFLPGTQNIISKPLMVAIKFVLTVYGIFNLDFFRYVVPPFCISSQLNMLHVLSLEYIVAFYPLFLIITIYICIQLHARDFKVFVYLWMPFQKCCSGRRNWNILESLIHAFAAFILLSYSKILVTSLVLLKVSNPLINSTGDTVSPLVVYYDASIPYFGTEHLPFALLAIFVLAVFIILPVLLLLLYQTRPFQLCLGCCNTRLQLALRTFVDAFQGCYKDGTADTPDWRCFSGLYLIFLITVNSFSLLWDDNYVDLLSLVHLGTWSLLFSLLRPYKKNLLNVFDSLAFALYWCAHYLQDGKNTSKPGVAPILYAFAVLPLLYIVVYFTYKLLSRLGILKHCSKAEKLAVQQQRDAHRSNCNDAEEMPDRVVRPEEYEQLLTTADCEREDEQGGGSGDNNTFPVFLNSMHQYGSV